MVEDSGNGEDDNDTNIVGDNDDLSWGFVHYSDLHYGSRALQGLDDAGEDVDSTNIFIWLPLVMA